MSQSRSSRQPPPPAPSSPLPGIISAVVVVVVLGLVATLLLNRNGDNTTAVAPTTAVDSAFATVDAGLQPSVASAPTVAAATAAPASGQVVGTPFPTAVAREFSAPPPLTIDATKRYTATITTPRGDVIVELLPDIAPQSVNNFVFLARQNFYNGLVWHRVLENFMAQGGDPAGDGTGGPGYSVPGEFTDQISFDAPGLLAMARSNDPDSAGSQFFITTGAAPWLDGQYTIFGRVVSGQEYINAIPLRDPQNPADLATPGETILGITISEE